MISILISCHGCQRLILRLKSSEIGSEQLEDYLDVTHNCQHFFNIQDGSYYTYSIILPWKRGVFIHVENAVIGMHGNAVVTFYAPTNAVCQICIYTIFKIYIIYLKYNISFIYIYIIIIIFIHPGTSRIRSHMTPYIPLNIHQPQPFLFVFAGPWSLDHCNPGTRKSWAEQAGRSGRGNLKHQGETRPATAQMGT